MDVLPYGTVYEEKKKKIQVYDITQAQLLTDEDKRRIHGTYPNTVSIGNEAEALYLIEKRVVAEAMEKLEDGEEAIVIYTPLFGVGNETAGFAFAGFSFKGTVFKK